MVDDFGYNFVFFGSDNDYFLYSYNDIMNREDVKYLGGHIDTDNNLLINLYRLHTSPITNKWIKLPFQRIWNPLIFRNTFKDDKPICFVFFARKERYINNGLIEYLKKKYLNSKLVIFFQDLISLSATPISWYKQNFDLVISFDQAEARKFGILYHHNVYSKIDTDALESDNDVYFLGLAKNRLNEIIGVYERLTELNIKCDFNIVGVKDEDRIYPEKIKYCEYMPYKENLKHVMSCKCILEILQDNASGFTLRTCEAITYGKNLITNNSNIRSEDFYSPENFLIYNTFLDINRNFIFKNTAADYDYADKLSPLRLLDYINANLKGNDENGI